MLKREGENNSFSWFYSFSFLNKDKYKTLFLESRSKKEDINISRHKH